MQDPATFRQYAEECERLAKTANEKDRAALLKIAEAWLECADEAERRSGGAFAAKSTTRKSI